MEDGNQLISASTPGKIKKKIIIPKSVLSTANEDLDLILTNAQRRERQAWGQA